ncbi:MAG: hypothetical protein ACPGQR_03625, partial [Marinirhabdus sp.]
YNKKYISHLDINVRQKKAIQYVKENGGITNAVYREEYKVTDRTAHRDIEELVDLSILKKEGAGRATKYLIDVSGYKGR